MATTTNYGWTTPDDTALLKDGAAAIRTLGSSVDTTTKALNPSTTLGDIEYRSSTANTNTRLGIGTTGQLLTVSGGVPAWATPASAGGMTLLSTTTLSGASTDISSISQDYKQLKVYVYGITASVNPIAYVVRTFNGASELTSSTGWRMSNYSTPAYTAGAAFRLTSDDSANQNVDGSSSNNFWSLIYDDYSSTTNYKSGYYLGNYVNTSAANVIWNSLVGISSNSAIDKLRFEITSGTFSTGTVKVYGVK